jgi:hypothetical protein
MMHVHLKVKGDNWIHLNTTRNVVVSWSIQEVVGVVVMLKLADFDYEVSFELLVYEPV